MNKSASILTTAFSALVTALAMAVLFAQPATAQTASKLNCKGCVKSKQLKNGGIKGKDLKDSAVTGSKVAGDTIPATDLQNEAGADFIDGDQDLALTITPTSVREVSITAPTSGVVIVNASGHFDFQSAAFDDVRCSITTDSTSISPAHAIRANDLGDVADEGAWPFGATRGFNVSAGTTTFHLVCEERAGVVRMGDSSMTAMFFPTTY